MKKVNKGETNVQTEKLPGYLAPAWSSRALSLGINLILMSYLAFYCTDIVGMNAATIGILLLVSKIVDGVTDLAVGFIIDKTHTIWGKARPYEWFILVVWVLTVGLFSVPDIGKTGQIIYVFVLYTLINAVCATFLNGGDPVYLARAVRKDDNRVKVVSISSFIAMIVVMIFTIVFPLMISNMGTTKGGWTKMILILAIPLAIIGIMRFLFVKEVETDETEQGKAATADHVSFKQVILAISKNKYIFIVSAALLAVNVINGMNTASSYYFKYVMGDIGLQSLASMTSMATLVMLIFYPSLQKKLGRGTLLRAGAVIGIVGILIRYIGGANMTTIIIGTLCSNIAIMPISAMLSLYVIDCMDYGEWKTGVRVEGGLSSVTSFASKLGAALASALTGIGMNMAHYDGTLSIQPESAMKAIEGLYNLLPLFMFIIMFILAIFYNLDKKLPRIREAMLSKSRA